MIDERFWYLFFNNETPITVPIEQYKVDTFAHCICTNGECLTPKYSYRESYKIYTMLQIMTKSKSIVCLDTQIHNNVENNALEWLSEERDLSERVFLALCVKCKQKTISLRIMAVTILSLAKNQVNKFKRDFQQSLPDCDGQLLLADTDLNGVVVNDYDYRQNGKFRELIDRQIYKNL